ncbi:hypothetical protein Tco_0078595 [Tanacetum coccineum]
MRKLLLNNLWPLILQFLTRQRLHLSVWDLLCVVCVKTLTTLRSKCRHSSSDFIPPPDCSDGIIRFVLYGFTKPSAPSSSDPLDHVDVLGQDVYGGFTLTLLDCLLSKGLRTFAAFERETLAEPALSLFDIPDEDLESSEQNIKQCKRKICDGHYTTAVRVLSSSGIAPYTDATLDDLKAKHPGTDIAKILKKGQNQTITNTGTGRAHKEPSLTSQEASIGQFPKGNDTRTRKETHQG